MIAGVSRGAGQVLSLRQSQSADVSDIQADPHARSKEWRLTDSLAKRAFRFSLILRQTIAVVGITAIFFGAQLAAAQLMSACVLYLPTHRYFAINTLLLTLPSLIFFSFNMRSLHQVSAKTQLLIAGISQALVAAVAAFALRSDCPSMAVIAPAVIAVALGSGILLRAVLEVAPSFSQFDLSEQSKTNNLFNSSLCMVGAISTLIAIALVQAISFALPAGLEVAASFILLGCAVVSKAVPASYGHKLDDSAQSPLSHASELWPFVVPASMAAVPVLTVLLLTLERNWVLLPQLLHTFEFMCAGTFLGWIFSFSPISHRFQLSQYSLPALITLATAFVLAISPGANVGVNADVGVALLGLFYVYSNCQLLSRAQARLAPMKLRQVATVYLLFLVLMVGFFTSSIQPFLDTISATMLVRYLGLEIVVTGSIALGAILLWQNKPLAERYICKASKVDTIAAPDYCAVSAAQAIQAE